MAFTTMDLQELLRLLEEQPQSRARLRALLVIDELQTVSERLDRLTGIVERLAEAQQRTEQRVAELAEAQQRTEQRLRELAEQTDQRFRELTERTDQRFRELVEAQRHTEERLGQLAEEVRALVNWQRGEAGRREGERYEHRIVKRAPALFHGGQGGATDQPFVQQRLTEILRSLPAEDTLTDDEDPFLADLIWWKDDQFIVVEASLQVNGNDVVRAARRADTLRRGNVQATGLVIGNEWASPDIRHQAKTRDVHWWVGDDLSEGLLAFRRVSS